MYQVKLSLLKTVTDWDPEEGSTGSERVIDTQTETIITEKKPVRGDGRSLLHDFVYSRYGLRVHDFRYWSDEPGRFTTNRLENGDGYADNRGKYLADYDVRIEVSTITPPKPLEDHLGLKSVDE